ncbi:MAG: pilus assembly protein PilZ, partial [Spirochaetales bacterium]|nr:pilus assembly protein PilZ [Spirochaetales bacterium]
MALVTTQQLNQFYQQYGELEVTFNRQVIQVLGLLSDQTAVKCLGDDFPCTIYSSSMAGAKVIAALRAESLKRLRQSNFLVSLRFCFHRPDRPEPLAFFVPGRVISHRIYDRSSPDLHFLTLVYSNKPPDDLILVLGKLLEANVNAKRRKEVRIEITPASLKALGLEAKEAALEVGGASRVCILRDLSFSGAKVLLFGVAEDLLQRPVVLQPAFSGHRGRPSLAGRILRYEAVVGREDIGAVGIQFDEG